MYMCKTLRRESRTRGADVASHRYRRCAGRKNSERTDRWTNIRTSEWTNETGEQTDCERFIHIQMHGLYDRANESENTLTHIRRIPVWRLLRGLRACLVVHFFVMPDGLLLFDFLGVSRLLRTVSQSPIAIQKSDSKKRRVYYYI